MLSALSFPTLLALLCPLLEANWSWANFFCGAIVAHILVGHFYFSQAISKTYLEPRSPASSPARAWAEVAIVDLSGAAFLGAFGTHLGVVLPRVVQRVRRSS